MEHRDLATLESGLDQVRASPSDAGVVELIARRTGPGRREVLSEVELDAVHGLVGNDWLACGSRHTADGSPELTKQMTLMNARASALIAGPKDRWALAGDQLYVDFDLSGDNLPVGTRRQVGTATIEITDAPHRGCAKFARRYGDDALTFVRSQVGRLNLRGIHARVIDSGTVRVGDPIRKATG